MFVQYGTPLVDPNAVVESVPKWKKRNEQDRVKERFHGAFTGGYSAGYFNSVGSKEGWAPSSFHSSRKEKEKNSREGISTEIPSQRPEDFMDEEDLRDQEDSIMLIPNITQELIPLSIETSLDSKIKKLLGDEGEGDNHGDNLSNGSISSIGYNILQKMGWKPGQGIGQRLTKIAKLGNRTIDYEIAPKNTVLSIQTLATTHYVGYNIDVPELPLIRSVTEVDNKSGIDSTKVKKRKFVKNLSIASNYEEDDDEDEDVISRKWTPKYDSELSQKPVFKKKKLGLKTSKNSSIQFIKRKCTDGTYVPAGFILSTRLLYITKDYPSPIIAEEYIKKEELYEEQQQPLGQVIDIKPIDSKSRAQLLKEPQLPSKSIFDMLTPEAQDRIEKLRNGIKVEPIDLPESKPIVSRSVTTSSYDTDVDDIPGLSETIAQEALSNAKYPYAEDLDKRQRYISVLKLYSNQSDERFFKSIMTIKPNTISHASWIRELNEFTKVAVVFRPLKGAIADRFTGSGGVKNEVKISSEYDPLTFKVTEFSPERLLCKRFGVAYSGVKVEEQKQVDVSSKSEPIKVQSEIVPSTSSIDPNINKALEAGRAPASLFAMVFSGSNEEEDDDDL